jgi:UPF0755 protein
VTDRDIVPRTRDPRDRRRARGRRRSFIAVLAALLVLALIAGALVVGGKQLVSKFVSGPGDYAGGGSGQVTVEVPKGAGAAKIGEVLQQAGVVKSIGAFTAAARDNAASRKIQPGFYRLRKNMKAALALALLLDPKARLRTRVTIAEGLTLKAILAKVAKDTEIPLEDLQAAVTKPDRLGLPKHAEGNVEGFLFPATYDVDPNATATSALKQMVDKYKSVEKQLRLVARAGDKNITPYEAVIVASLIERETARDDERSKVARVIYNRLKIGMPLQIDATIQYILPKPKAELLTTDTQIDSPYNTYRNAGLPPGPIASPGAASLEAALAPATGNWLYYLVTGKNGQHTFTSSYDEFLRLKAKARAAGG